MISIEKLKKYAKNLMFQMKENEYQTLQQEFETIEKQMDLIGKIKGIEKIEPMTFPFITHSGKLRKDEVKNTIVTEDLLKNAKEKENNQIRIPKVVE